MAPPPGRRARLIIKPVPVPELGGDPVPHIRRRLLHAGIACDVTVTQPRRPLAADVRDALAAPERPDFFIAAGGDGTHGPVAAALVGTGVPLGFISLGTFNNFARTLRIPRQLDAALDVIIAGITSGQPRPVDAGRVNDRIFFESAGAGWDATLFPLGENLKRGRLRAVLGAVRDVFGYKTDPITLLLDGERRITSYTPTVVVANGPYYGSSIAVAPTSRDDDGLLVVTLFESFGKAELLAYFAAVADGQPRRHDRVVSHRAARVEIVEPVGLPAHADGEPIGPLRTPFEAVPQALLAITPPGDVQRGRARTAKWVIPAPAPAAAGGPPTATDERGASGPRAEKRTDRTIRWRVPQGEPSAGGDQPSASDLDRERRGKLTTES